MSLEASDGRRSVSPLSAGRASPIPAATPATPLRSSSPLPARTSRRLEEGIFANPKDKAVRRYAVGIERALASFDGAVQEWADYIAFLTRLLKAVQLPPPNIESLPHASSVTLRLSQCLSPALPSGVHQKALDVYTTILSLLSRDAVGQGLHTYLPPLLPVLSFASLSVRPLYYTIFEQCILKLRPEHLRPATKALILCLLPGLEDETSEDFERAFRILDGLRRATATAMATSPVTVASTPHVQEQDIGDVDTGASDGFFWQCFFLAAITNPPRRQGALVYLARKLPTFATPRKQDPTAVSLSEAAEAAITPEPGLLVRCFSAGLQDGQILVQRGFLDLLVTHLPMHSPLLQRHLRPNDMDLLTSAAVTVVLRRDMSLNRRLWSWFLGPDITGSDADDTQPQSPSDSRQEQPNSVSQRQATYFHTFGAKSLERSIMAMLAGPTLDPTHRARPFRICLSLMDRWEVGGQIVPKVLLPALGRVFEYSLTGPEPQVNEVVRSASLFFDGVEGALIWSNLITVMLDALQKSKTDPNEALRKLHFIDFVLTRFDVKEEDMLLHHMPNALLVLFAKLADLMRIAESGSSHFLDTALDVAQHMLRLLPPRAFSAATKGKETNKVWNAQTRDSVSSALTHHYTQLRDEAATAHVDARTRAEYIIQSLVDIFQMSLNSTLRTSMLTSVTDSLVLLLPQVEDSEAIRSADLSTVCRNVLKSTLTQESKHLPFVVISSIVTTVSSALSNSSPHFLRHEQILDLQNDLLTHLWCHLSPFEPKYHVEAVRLIWTLESWTKSEHRVEARLAALVGLQLDTDGAETAGRFSVLWEHSVQSLATKPEAPGRPVSRRPSAMQTLTGSSGFVEPEAVLTRPLLLLLDSLDDETSGAADVVSSWLQNLTSLDRVLHLLLVRLQDGLSPYAHKKLSGAGQVRAQRDTDQRLEDAIFCLQHLRNILRRSSAHTWAVLADLQLSGAQNGAGSNTGLNSLAFLCLQILALEGGELVLRLHHAALSVVQIMLESPCCVLLRDLKIDDTLIGILTRILRGPVGSLQSVYLHAISRALKIRAVPSHNGAIQSMQLPMEATPGQVKSANGETEKTLQTAPAPPPPELLRCLQIGLSSPCTFLFLEHWVSFLDEVLPLYADTVFANLLPLVDSICKQVAAAFQYLRDTAEGMAEGAIAVPVTALSALLHGLELILAHVHRLFQSEEPSSPASKSPEPSSGFFGSMVSGVFSADGPSTRTSRINSRLTMILSFQDAIRTCFHMWAWASHNDSVRLDPTCAASSTLNALKLRNRTRRILEHLFVAEELECLESLALIWARPKAGEESHSAVVFSLLHVLDGSRPKNTIPVIINALYSRTNIDALDLGRRSSLTSDLSTTEVIAFLLGYTRTIEDDATDEIWNECTTFLKDVLSNPLPHRQILPGLLEFTVLLAEKIDNTNFGDLRKMRRELGDIFLRLLAATFTVRPISNMTDNRSPTFGGNDDLINSLLYVIPKFQTVLQSPDRVLNAVNSISTSVIGPILHAKSFPDNISENMLRLFEYTAQQGPTAKSWKKDMAEAFNNPRLLTCSAGLVQIGWFPVLRRWALSDKDRMPEQMSRLTAPSTAGIMFGVGANAARLEADRRTQLTLRRVILLLLACEQDTFVDCLELIIEKVVELCAANLSSSPSSTTRAEVFMLMRALVLCFSTVHLSNLWPIINTTLQAALLSCVPGASEKETYGNLSLLQACKLLDLLMTLASDEFQLHEWLYLTDTIDAVYRPVGWDPIALADEIAESLGTEVLEQPSNQVGTTLTAQYSVTDTPQPLLKTAQIDGADTKAMARDDFIRNALQPFFSQLSMYAYEVTYGLGSPDMETCRRGLIEDVLDESTMA